jgi:hypothetical protein
VTCRDANPKGEWAMRTTPDYKKALVLEAFNVLFEEDAGGQHTAEDLKDG